MCAPASKQVIIRSQSKGHASKASSILEHGCKTPSIPVSSFRTELLLFAAPESKRLQENVTAYWFPNESQASRASGATRGSAEKTGRSQRSGGGAANRNGSDSVFLAGNSKNTRHQLTRPTPPDQQQSHTKHAWRQRITAPQSSLCAPCPRRLVNHHTWLEGRRGTVHRPPWQWHLLSILNRQPSRLPCHWKVQRDGAGGVSSALCKGQNGTEMQNAVWEEDRQTLGGGEKKSIKEARLYCILYFKI